MMRKHKMAFVVVLSLSLLGMEAFASEVSSGTDQEVREIKALSDSDIADLLSGKGMGYAKVAELNGYPGPAHVLDLADKLDLSSAERRESQAIFDRMEASAKRLGADLVNAERALDEKFEKASIDEASLSDLVAEIGRIQSQLRTVHLNAHLELRRVLSERQVAEYMMLRGYRSDGHESHHHHEG